jgi:hypothetical protein
MVVVPRYVKDAIPKNSRHHFEESELFREMVTVCSGDLVKQTVSVGHCTKTFHYSLTVPVSASSVLLAVGPFEVYRIPGWKPKKAEAGMTADGVPDESNEPAVEEAFDESDIRPSSGGYSFCLPGYHQDLTNTIEGIYEAMETIQKYVGVSFPYQSFKVVFVENAYAPLLTGAGIAIAR